MGKYCYFLAILWGIPLQKWQYFYGKKNEPIDNLLFLIPYNKMKVKRQTLILGAILNIISATAFAQYPGQTQEAIKINTCAPLKAAAFDYADVELLESPFKHAMEVDQRWLKEADVNRFLHNFRVTAGIKTGAQAFGGWEGLDCELRGHSLGHFLSALALMYAATHDETYRTKGKELVKGLAECQQTIGTSGYLSAFPEHFIDRAIAGGDVVWAPWYTLHKMYAGLLDQYLLCKNQQACDVLMKMCNWAYQKLKPLPDEDLQRMLLAEFGGMSEVFYNIYAVTGDVYHKELAEMFYHPQILNPLAARKDSLAGIHANTQIPKIVGEARRYELTGRPESRDIATFFWNTVVADHSYVTGGNSDKEIFSKPRELSQNLSENTTETCNTYNMLKLTRHLFTWDASPVYADYYERALYNHILSSQDPVSGGVTYYHTLHPGSAKNFHYPFHDNTCCVGTGYENHAKYEEAIYYKTADGQGLYVNLFIPSVLNWWEKGIVIRQETAYPDEASTELTIDTVPTGGIKIPVFLRYPSWATNGVTVKVNGKKQSVKKAPGSYIRIDRLWQKNDVITIEMPMSLHIEYMPDNKKKGAILYGPIVLAAELGKKTDSKENPQVPLLTNNPEKIAKWLKPVEGKPLTFRTEGAAQPSDIVLSPLFRNCDQHYTVYFDFK